MKITNLRQTVYRTATALATVAAAVSCAADPAGASGADGSDNEPATVEIVVPQISTRAIIDTDDEQEGYMSLKWADDDSFLLWAQGPTTVSNRTFTRVADALADPSQVLFRGTMRSTMSEGEYTYHALCPADRAAVSGSEVRFEIPAVQSGRYDPSLDVMYASTSGGALSTVRYNELDFKFRHLTHALKITVPEEYDSFGHEIHAIEIVFPQPVVGNIVCDLTEGAVSNELSGNKITVRFDEPPTAGKPFWVFVAPQTEVSGEVTFTPFGGEDAPYDRYSAEASRTEALRKFAEGHITPVNLGLKEAFELAWFDFDIDPSQLGEEVELLHLALPEGHAFADGTSAATLAPDTDGLWKAAFRASELESLGGTTLSPVYESEHAMVAEYAGHHDPQMDIAVGSYTTEHHNLRSVMAPWLFFEDFCRVESFSSNDTHRNSNEGSKSAVSFLDGWTGARIGAEAGTSIRIACYRSNVLTIEGAYPGRVDSAPLSNLKAGANVAVSLTMDYGMNQDKSSNSAALVDQTVNIGTVETQDGLASGSGEGNYMTSFTFQESDGNWNNIPNRDRTFTLDDCNRSSRISIKTTPSRGSNNSNNTCWLYLDNIRVSISGMEQE